MIPGFEEQNSEVEKTVLCTMIICPDSIERGRRFLTRDVFREERHALIFMAILAVDASEDEVDFLSVLGQLRQSGRLEEVGGSPYLVEVTSEGPAPPETFLGGGGESEWDV